MLMLESFQAGLSWECVLNKRDSFRRAFDGFDVNKVCCYGSEKIAELLDNPEIIRNKRKIHAGISNSQIFRAIVAEYGSFYAYLTTFTEGKTIFEVGRVTNALSDAISNDLRCKGMKFVGSTIIYAYLQAIGVIYSHDPGCYLYRLSES
jgi:DNA-3-methyladenine glycosylase I